MICLFGYFPSKILAPGKDPFLKSDRESLMMNEDTTGAYDQLDAALSLADIQVLPAEVHGIIVGALCNHLYTGNRPDLMAMVLDRPEEEGAAVSELRELSYSIYRSTMELLLEGEGDFTLQLPHESDALEFRT